MAFAIRRVRLRRVRIPLRIVYVSSMYVMPATVRTVVEVESDDGVVGLGETLGTEDVFRLTRREALRWIGHDARNRRARQQAFARSVFDNRNGRNGWSAFAGLEMAAWDLVGKGYGCSVAELLGGGRRHSIEVVSPLPALVLEVPLDRSAIERHYQDPSNAEPVVQLARTLAATHGIRHFKYKSAGRDPDWDWQVMHRLDSSLGSSARLRFDPNAAYSITRAIALGRRLEPLGLEFFEDPTDDLEGLAAFRSRVRSPVATNMFVVQVDHLPAAIRRQAVDVVLGDVYMWGGIDRFRAMAAVVRQAGLEIGVHSLFETGIGTALNLQLAAALPEITRASDTGLHFLARDVITGPGFPISGGTMTVPDGPGLGIALDEAAMTDLTIEEATIDGT